MDKLVESLRVLLENERDGVLHVDGEGGAAAAGKIRRQCGSIAENIERGWMECGEKDRYSAKTAG